MKKIIPTLMLCFLLVQPAGATVYEAPAPPILGLITTAVKKAIKAIDLKIQRLQNKTIWLQNAQKEIENTLSKLKLREISGWSRRQKELYQQYYQELTEVKSIITYYQRIRDITEQQSRLIEEYHRFRELFQSHGYFSDEELEYMEKVYQGILAESLDNIEQLFTILESFTTQMSDAQRLELINAAADRRAANYSDLMLFNRQNALLSLQRSKTKAEVQQMQRRYNIP